jgi:hypothetical protein
LPNPTERHLRREPEFASVTNTWVLRKGKGHLAFSLSTGGSAVTIDALANDIGTTAGGVSYVSSSSCLCRLTMEFSRKSRQGRSRLERELGVACRIFRGCAVKK